MNTKVIMLGNQTPSKMKRIEFVNVLNVMSGNNKFNIMEATTVPSDFSYVELICRKYHGPYDLMFAYDNPEHRGEGILYIGHFNDGVV